MSTTYSLELVEPDAELAFGHGDSFWKELVTRLWTKRGELWSYPQDAYGVGMISVRQEDADVLEQIDMPDAKFVLDILRRTRGAVHITRHP